MQTTLSKACTVFQGINAPEKILQLFQHSFRRLHKLSKILFISISFELHLLAT